MLKKFILLLIVILMSGGNIAGAADFLVPPTTLTAAIAGVNAAGGNNTITFTAPFTVSAAIANITQNVAISGVTPTTTVTFTGTNHFVFAGVVPRTYSITNLTILGATNSAATVALGHTLTVNNVVFNSNVSQVANGAAIQNNGTLIIDNAIFNSDVTTSGNGGAIQSTGTTLIGQNSASAVQFNNNVAASGGAISAGGTLTIDNTTFNSNGTTSTTTGYGGAVAFGGTLLNIGQTAPVVFTNNNAQTIGGALYSYVPTNIDNAVFSGNTANLLGGAIHVGQNNTNTGATMNIGQNSASAVQFTNNSAGTSGGAIYNKLGSTLNLSNSNFNGNSAGTSGGAIYNGGTLNLSSTPADITFTGNTAGGAANDIFNNAAVININGTANNIVINDGIAGTGTINKSNNGGLVLGADSINTNYTGSFIQTGGTTSVYTTSFFSGLNQISNSNLNLLAPAPAMTINTLSLNNVNVNTINGAITAYTINNFIVGPAGANFAIDINANSLTSDTFMASAGTFAGGAQGNINISNIFISGVPTAPEIPFSIFTLTGLDATTFSESIGTINTPLYQYEFISDGLGNFRLVRTGANKQAFRGQVATMSAYYNQLLVNNVLFDHVYLDSELYGAFKNNNNKYAAISPLFAPYQYTRENGSVWYKSYAAFERLAMTQDINVENNAYGSLVGADFEVIKLRRGWKLLPTAYVGYNGGHQTFEGVSMYQNGGQGGFMGTFMKGQYIASWLAYAGGYGNQMALQGTTDRTGNWFAGTAIKNAYNFRPSKHCIIQPTALVSYNIFGRQEWGSDFGAVSMVAGYLNGINVGPGLNFIYGRETWSVYLTSQYLFNINEKVNGSIGNLNLPNLEMRHGFIAYGIGATKTWKERLMSYIQIAIHNGGRSGVFLQAGLMWKL